MPNIVVASWADLGYRCCGPLPNGVGTVDGAFFAEALHKRAGYEIIGKTWIRRRGRAQGSVAKHCLSIREVIDIDTVLDERCLAFADDYFNSIWRREQILPPAPGNLLVEMVRGALGKRTAELEAQAIIKAIAVCQSRQLAPLLREHVLPWFFNKYPDGRVVVIEHSPEFENLMSGMRCFYTAAQVPYEELMVNARIIDDRFPTLKHWHDSSPALLARPLLEFWNCLLRPLVFGFRAELFGLTLFFLFGAALKYVPLDFPSDWLAVPQSCASFGAEPLSEDEFYGVVAHPTGPLSQRAANQPPPHTLQLTPEQQVEFLRWYLDTINRYLFELTDVANFTEESVPDKAIDPIGAFEHYLTINRLLRRTLGAMSSGNASSAKGIVFEVADLLDTISTRFASTGATVMFKRLFNTTEAPNLLCSQLKNAPEPVGSYLSDFTRNLYGGLESAVLKSVWLKSKVQGTNVLVRNRQLTGELPEAISDFVGNLMRAYRNGHHGYFSSEDEPRPSRYLFLVDGTIPDALASLPSIWFLAYLIDPGIVGWRRLELGTYP